MKKFKSNFPSKLYIYGLERPMICLSTCVIIPDVKTVSNRRKLKMSDLHEVKNLGRDLNIDSAESEFFGLAYFSKKGIISLLLQPNKSII